MRPRFFLPSKTSRSAFTLIELLVVIAIIGVLAGLLLPVFGSAKESGRSTKCLSNLRQIGTAMDLYANEHNNNYPPLVDSTKADVNWDSDAINPYLPERPDKRQSVLFICPSAVYKGNTNSDLSRTYSATECMTGPSGSFSLPGNRSAFFTMAGTLVLFDALQSGTLRYAQEEVTWGNISGGADLKAGTTAPTYIDYRHRGAFHGLFADGHVDTIDRNRASTMVTEVMWKGKKLTN